MSPDSSAGVAWLGIDRPRWDGDFELMVEPVFLIINARAPSQAKNETTQRCV
jgi:hypothetical protein